MEKNVNQSVLRKRGRPAGKNRVPLSQTERRARNAQYERERREGLADSFADLAAAISVSGSISNSELLATVITHLQKASRIKHSSDVESLTRCNKNLMAQIEKLERQLAEPDQACSAFPSQEDVIAPRAVKRERDDELPGAVPIPKRSLQDNEYAPLLNSERDTACPEFMEQQYFPGPSPSPAYLPEAVFIPECSSPSTLTQDHKLDSSAPNYLFKEEFPAPDPWLPNAAMSAQNFLPVPKLSPVSSTSDQQDQDLDFSSYHFAGPQIPTPEYQIETTSDCVHPVQLHTEQVYYHQPPHHFGASPPEVQFSQYLIPETYPGSSTLRSGPSSPDEVFTPPHYLRSQQPYVFRTPVLPNVFGSMGIIPVPGSSDLPDERGAEPHQGGFLSTEEMVSLYF